MQIATGAVCSNESGIEKSRTFTALSSFGWPVSGFARGFPEAYSFRVGS